MKLESIGKVIASGFGDRVFIGVFLGLLDNVTPERCYQYIRENMQLLHWASEKDWQRYKKLAKPANIGDLTTERIVSELRKHKPELLGVIINHPQGLKWLDNQIAEMKKKME